MIDSGILMIFGIILVMMLLLCVGMWILARENSRLNKRIDEISEDFSEKMNDIRNEKYEMMLEMDTIKLKMDEIM